MFFLDVYPSRPNVIESIEIGVGVFGTEVNACGTALTLIPGDDRTELWLDPRILYRLHDQTVEIYAEITTEPDHVVKPFAEVTEDSYQNEDGSVQFKGKNISGVKVKVEMERIPDMEGTFIMKRKLVPVYRS